MKKSVFMMAFLMAAMLYGGVPFPGIKCTDRAKVEAAARNGNTKYDRVMGKIRLVQIDDPAAVDTYAKQSALIEKFCAEEQFDDPSLKFSVPLCSPSGQWNWTIEGWHDAHAAGHFREMYYLTNSSQGFKNARIELGDDGLFKRYCELLRKFLPKYSAPATGTAIQFMRQLLPAADPAFAESELTYIRSRIRSIAKKNPEKFDQTIAMIDRMLDDLKKRN